MCDSGPDEVLRSGRESRQPATGDCNEPKHLLTAQQRGWALRSARAEQPLSPRNRPRAAPRAVLSPGQVPANANLPVQSCFVVSALLLLKGKCLNGEGD